MWTVLRCLYIGTIHLLCYYTYNTLVFPNTQIFCLFFFFISATNCYILPISADLTESHVSHSGFNPTNLDRMRKSQLKSDGIMPPWKLWGKKVSYNINKTKIWCEVYGIPVGQKKHGVQSPLDKLIHYNKHKGTHKTRIHKNKIQFKRVHV